MNERKITAQFGRGIPHDAMLQEALIWIKRCEEKVWDEYLTSSNAKGYETKISQYKFSDVSDFCGLHRLRQYIAENKFKRPDFRNIVATNGGMELVTLLLIALRERIAPPVKRNVILTEAMTYNRVVTIAELLGYDVAGVDLTEKGADLDELDELCEELKPVCFYQVSPHHNPTGLTTDREYVERAADICEKHDVLHIVDMAYLDMRYDGRNNDVIDLEAHDSTVVCSNFTKSVEPGHKCGFGYIPDRYFPGFDTAAANARLNPNYHTQAMYAVALESGDYDRHLQKLKKFYGQRCRWINDYIREYFPETTEELPFVAPLNGGCFSVLLIKGLKYEQEEEFRTSCAERGLTLEKPNFFAPGKEVTYIKRYDGLFYRVPFLALDQEQIGHGFSVLKEAQEELAG